MTVDERPNEGVADELAQDKRVPHPRAVTLWDRIISTITALCKRLGAHGTLILTLAVGLALFYALGLAAAQVYSNVTDEDGVASLDQPALELAVAIRTPWLNTVLTWYTNIAGKIGMPVIAVVAILLLSIRRRSWTPAILISAAGLGSVLMTVAGKVVFGRDRPPLSDAVPPYEYSDSFPSGHTLNAVAVVGTIAYLLVLRQTTHSARVATIAIAALFMLTTGLTRVFLGHHWLTDVLFAWALGLAWLVAVITAHQCLRYQHRVNNIGLCGSAAQIRR